MENSIEHIWKQGFLNESSLVAPKVNDLYNRKSMHVVDRIKRRMKKYRVINFAIVIITPIMYYFMGAFWYGVAFSTVALFIMRYTGKITRTIKTLDQGANSYDYLKEFDRLLDDMLSKFEKIARFTLPLYMLIGHAGLWASWHKIGFITILQKRHPNVDVEFWALAYLVIFTLPFILFPVKIYRGELRMVYGRLRAKLKETIAEMEKLKQGE
jgi:hypothetical protein